MRRASDGIYLPVAFKLAMDHHSPNSDRDGLRGSGQRSAVDVFCCRSIFVSAATHHGRRLRLLTLILGRYLTTIRESRLRACGAVLVKRRDVIHWRGEITDD
jgi:acyl-coenzyme A thioesterase PaaI-like protein